MMSGSEEQQQQQQRWGGEVQGSGLNHLLERVANDLTPQDSHNYYQSGFIPSATPPWNNNQTSLTSHTSLGSGSALQAAHNTIGQPAHTTIGQAAHTIGSGTIQPAHTIGSGSSIQAAHTIGSGTIQNAHGTLGGQCGLPNHGSLGSAGPQVGPQVSPMQSNVGPSSPVTTSASPIGCGPSQISGSARSYSVSQDLFTELDGSRSPLFRSSSDLGLRLNHSLGSHFGDGRLDARLDGFLDSSMDSLDGMLGPDSYYLDVKRTTAGHGTPPPHQTDQSQQQSMPSIVPVNQSQQSMPTVAPVSRSEFSFYSNENDRILETESSSMSAKFANITGAAASLGSWFSPFDPFRTNLNAKQTKIEAKAQQSQAGVRSAETIARESGNHQGNQRGNHASQIHATQSSQSSSERTHKPSYSAVLSKSPASEGKPQISRTPNSVNSSSPSPATAQKSRGSAKLKTRNSGGAGGNGRQGRSENSRVGLDDFDLNEGLLSNGISAYEHYDWGEARPQLIGNGKQSSASQNSQSGSQNSPNHQTKYKGERKSTPEKVSGGDVDILKGDHLNNKISFMQQKQPPKRTPYINNNLSASNCSLGTNITGNTSSNIGSSIRGNCTQSTTPVNPAPSSPNHDGLFTGQTTLQANTNNPERSSNNKPKNSLPFKEDKKSPDNSNRGSSGRSKVMGRNISDRNNAPRRNTTRRKKDASFLHSEVLSQGMTICVQWATLAMRAILWLGTLATDVVVMSSRLVLQLLALIWGRMQDYWAGFKVSVAHYWKRMTSAFTSKEKEEKKLPGRDKKVSGGLDCNINLPTTGEEAMKRLLACKGKDPYSILGVTRDCTDDDIKKYYKRQAFLVHPDKNKQPGAEEAFKILAHAFEIIGEPERRSEYDVRLAEEVQLEGAWGELASLLTRLQEKLDEAANTIRCTNCNKRHRRVKLPRPIYAARDCAECKIHHAAREGDIWAESSMLGLRWRYYACMEGAVYDISDWAACQSDHLKHLQANTHSVQYRIVSGKKNPPSKSNTPEFPSDPDLEEFFNNLCKEKFGKNYCQGNSQGGGQQMPDTRKRKGKKKK